MLHFSRPEWLLLLLLLPPLALIFRRTGNSLERGKWWAALLLRCAVLAFLALALAEPHFVRKHDRLTVIFAVDQSRSIPENIRLKSQDYVRQVARKVKQGDRVGVVGFDGQADIDQSPRVGGPESIHFGLPDEPDRTDVGAGLRMALAAFPPDSSRRIVLLTDGNENTGHLLDEVEAAAAAGAVVDVVPLEYNATQEMLVDRLSAPSHVRPESRIQLRAVLRSRQKAKAKLIFYHNETMLPMDDSVIELSGNMRPDVVTVSLDLMDAGVHRFEVRLAPVDAKQDTVAENNRGTAFTFVESSGKVLVLGPMGSAADRPLVEALTAKHVEVDYFPVDEFMLDLVHLQEYNTVVMGNIPSTSFNDTQQEALARYVRDLGGGLILTGGDQAMGAGGWAGTPIEEISPVAFTIPPDIKIMNSALVIVLDHSGSMGSPVGGSSRNQQEIANEASVLAIRSLLPQDLVGVVAFDDQPTWVVPVQPNTNRAAIANKVSRISPAGGTNIYPALYEAVHALKKVPARFQTKHIILLSDGQSQDGPYGPLIADMVAANITLSTIGVGDARNNPVLEMLAKQGGGKYHPVTNPQVLPKVFFRETRMFRTRLVSENPFYPDVMASSFPILVGLGPNALPSLDGFVRTAPKPDAINCLVNDEEKHLWPILSHWQCEMGRVAAFTSGWWPKWGQSWVQWPSFGDFWRQVVEWTMSEGQAEGFEVMTVMEGDQGRIVVEAVGDNASFMNFLNIYGSVVSPQLETHPVVLTQTGSGRYEARFDVKEVGDYVIHLVAHDGHKSLGSIRTGLSIPYSPEYRELQANTLPLAEAAERTGGKVYTFSAELDDPFRRDLPPVTSRSPIWWWVVMWCLLPFFVMDVAARRLASRAALSVYVELGVLATLIGVAYLLDAGTVGYVLALIIAEVVGWTMRWPLLRAAVRNYMNASAAAAAAGKSREQVLERLGQTRQETARQFESSPPGESLVTEPRRPHSQQDWGDLEFEDEDKPITDGVLGNKPRPITESPAKADSPGDSGQPTSDLAARLKRAKKQAHQRWQDEQGGGQG